MAANYDNSAWFYDRLSRLVYGRAIINSQIFLLSFIPANSKVLIVGGGTGWILTEIAKVQSMGLDITYVEISAQMMALAQKKNKGENRVTFINEAIENFENAEKFDVVITPFLFDNFTQETLQKVFLSIDRRVKINAIWLNTNFQLTNKWWQTLLLKSMFTFFRIVCYIEAKELPGIKRKFTEAGYFAATENTFYKEFILSTVYKKVN